MPLSLKLLSKRGDLLRAGRLPLPGPRGSSVRIIQRRILCRARVENCRRGEAPFFWRIFFRHSRLVLRRKRSAQRKHEQVQIRVDVFDDVCLRL